MKKCNISPKALFICKPKDGENDLRCMSFETIDKILNSESTPNEGE